MGGIMLNVYDMGGVTSKPVKEHPLETKHDHPNSSQILELQAPRW
jgi:hypothetical protein